MDDRVEKNVLKLLMVQFDPLWEDIQANLTELDRLLETVNPSVDVVLLPESFSSGFSMKPEKVAETMEGKAVTWMKQFASRNKMAVCGSLFIAENGQYFNRLLWVDPEGNCIHYDKRHLFSMGDEALHYHPGKRQVLIEYKGWKIFPQICYDLRFPVWSRNTMAYDLLLNVANWPAARDRVWQTLLKARAIENQCYVAGVNRIGADGNNIAHLGQSMVVDFKGEVLQSSLQPGLIECEIDKKACEAFRKKFDTLKDADRFTLEH
ncbi:amidohydrolase [Roseimarinus sediminis]|uniref:amidohydrolase n=1 Tax=Roseimarinus sediminis TaxID=1610899 RepID=UPI003D1BC5B9